MANNETLLDILKRLYTKVFLVSLHNRISQYHSSVSSNQHHEIGSSLHELIDGIIKDASHNDYSPNHISEGKALSSGGSNKLQDQQTTIVSMTLDGLSLYFKRHKALEKDPGVAARLRRCVWGHVHSAHRYARMGDGRMAKIHVAITCDAMKTLSHYMTSEEYSDFYTLINERIGDSNKVEINQESSDINI